MRRLLVIVSTILIVAVAMLVFMQFGDNSRPAKEKIVMAEFTALMDKKGMTAAEIIHYVDKNFSAISPESTAKMVMGLEKIQKTNLAEWQEKYEDSALQVEVREIYQKGITRSSLSTIQNDDVKKILHETLDNGFKVETAEGFFFPVIDYAFFEKYHQNVTPDMAAYLEIMAVESEHTPVKDAALMISWDEILERALRQEQFIRQYNDSPLVEAMRQTVHRYTTFALFGANNTPLFSYGTQEMVPEAKSAYLERAWDKEAGSFSAIMAEYLDVLGENEYCLTPEIDIYRKRVNRLPQ